MSKHVQTAARLESFAAEALARLPELEARLEDLLSVVRAAIADDSRLVEAGRALDEIVAEKLFMVRRHRSLSGLLAEIGISRSTAYNWRVLSRSASPRLDSGRTEAYASAPRRADPRAGALPRGAWTEARRVAASLRRVGITAKVTPYVARGELRFVIDVDRAAAERLTRR